MLATTLTGAETMGEIIIKLTPTKVEQLELIRKYDRGFNEPERDIEEIAQALLYDAIRAKYNYYREKHGEEL